MSKIICDVCGTSYPETATQCPICGCVRPGDAVTVSGDTAEAAKKPSAYTPVKGGRFSKANVRKRNSGKPLYNAEPSAKVQKKQQTPTAPANTPKQTKTAGQYSKAKPSKPAEGKEISKKAEIGMTIAVIVLLLAIAAVVIYIAASFLNVDKDSSKKEPSKKPSTSQNGESTEPSGGNTTDPTTPVVKCTGLTVKPLQHTINTITGTIKLEVSVEPKECTEKVNFSTENPDIIDVSADGLVKPVRAGAAEVVVTCGEMTAVCRIICNLPADPEDPTEPPVIQEEYSKADLTFRDNGFGYEYTFNLSDKSYNPYNGSIPANLIEFSSNDEAVATVDETGLVTFVGSGRAIITAKYKDWTIECIVRVN